MAKQGSIIHLFAVFLAASGTGGKAQEPRRAKKLIACGWDRTTGDGKGAARASGVANGCFLQDYPVAPGQRYVVGARRRTAGKGDAAIRVRWQTSDTKWIQEHLDKMVFCESPLDRPRGDWEQFLDVVQVPEGVQRLVVLLGVVGQKSPEDVVWYDDVEVYRLP